MIKTTKDFSHYFLSKIVIGGIALVCLALAPAVLAQQVQDVCPSDQFNLIFGSGTTPISNLIIWTDARNDANWQASSPGYAGNVIIDGIQASERTSGSFAYAGTIYTNDTTLGAWGTIVTGNNPPHTPVTQAFASFGNTALVTEKETQLVHAFQYINGLTVSGPYTNPVLGGATFTFSGVAATSLNGLNTKDNIAEVFVINVLPATITTKINIEGDRGDLFIFRWDSDQNFTNGYQGQVKFQSGGAIVPVPGNAADPGLTPGNFIHVAGDIAAAGGGTPPAPPYPQGPRLDNGLGALISGGSDWSDGGFFTGYWLTTGPPTTLDPASGLYIGNTGTVDKAVFVGGWYSISTQVGMTSGSAGVNVVCQTLIPTAAPADIKGRVINDNGRGINRATVTLTNLSTGDVQYALTNPFGYYGFDGVETEQVYLLEVYAKGYKFANNSRTITLLDNLTGADFVGTRIPPGRTLLKKGIEFDQ